MNIIDCDRHVIEPLDMWEQYLSSNFNDIPKIELSFDNEVKLAERVSKGFLH